MYNFCRNVTGSSTKKRLKKPKFITFKEELCNTLKEDDKDFDLQLNEVNENTKSPKYFLGIIKRHEGSNQRVIKIARM